VTPFLCVVDDEPFLVFPSEGGVESVYLVRESVEGPSSLCQMSICASSGVGFTGTPPSVKLLFRAGLSDMGHASISLISSRRLTAVSCLAAGELGLNGWLLQRRDTSPLDKRTGVRVEHTFP
jgi:hypothetical protein